MPIDEKHEARKKVRKKGPKRKRPATKRFIDISEVRDNVVVMRDGTLRAVLLVSSINFYLKGADEQDAIIAAYVAFLNSLESPIQIVVQSRRLNIDPYLAKLREMESTHTTELMKIQTAEYRTFVKDLIELGDIMSRRYFVVVPYNPVASKRKGFFKRFSELWAPGATIKLKEEKFQDRKRELDLVVARVSSSLSSMGLKVAQLDTQSLIELYYQTYNPDLSAIEKMVKTEKLQVEI